MPLVVIIRRGGSLLLATLGGVERVGWRADPLAAHKMLLRGLVSILNRGGRLWGASEASFVHEVEYAYKLAGEKPALLKKELPCGGRHPESRLIAFNQDNAVKNA